jgi:hypothetical protein
MKWKLSHIEKLAREGKIRGYQILSEVKEAKRSKYKNTKTCVDNIQFDSAKEARRYRELKMLLKAGEIGMLELQVPYELNQGGTHSLKYIADFVYVTKEGVKIVEDVKGFCTKEYLKKRRLMLKVYGIKINEI